MRLDERLKISVAGFTIFALMFALLIVPVSLSLSIFQTRTVLSFGTTTVDTTDIITVFWLISGSLGLGSFLVYLMEKDRKKAKALRRKLG